MLNEFNEGGTHEQNPLGGIPMGQSSNGNMNTVEQGETMKGDFVYSNRIMITPQMIAQFNLPKNLEGKSVADATKLINKKFEGRNSKIDNSTKKNFLDRIAQAQEAVKAEEEAKQAQIAQSMEANSTEVPDMMNGQIPQGMEEFTNQNQMYDGGIADKTLSIDQPFQGGNTDFNSMSGNTSGGSGKGGVGYGQLGSIMGSLGTAIAPGGTYGKQQIQNEQSGFYDKKLQKDQIVEQGLGQVQDSVASAFGPIGMAVRGGQKLGKSIGDAIGGEAGGAVSSVFDPLTSMTSNLTNEDLSVGEKALGMMIPGVGGVISSRAAKKRADKFATEKRTREYYDKYIKPTEDFSGVNINAFGGKINQYRQGGPFDKNYSLRTDDPNYTSTPEEGTLTNAQFTNDLVNQFNNRGENIRQFGQNVNPHDKNITSSDTTSKSKFNLGEKLSNMDGSFLRYSPVAMNAFQLATLGGPDVEKLDRLNNQYKRQFLDEKAYENIARQQAAATTNAIGRSGISGGQLVNAQLASQLNKTKAVSEAYNQMRQHNIGENKMKQQVDFANNQANLQQSNLENDINARNKGAFNTERSRLLGQMGTDSGNIGNEEVYKKLAKEAFGYTWDGKYVRNNKGEVVKNPDTDKPMTKEDLDKAKQYSENFSSMKSLKFSPLNLNTKK